VLIGCKMLPAKGVTAVFTSVRGGFAADCALCTCHAYVYILKRCFVFKCGGLSNHLQELKNYMAETKQIEDKLLTRINADR